MVRGPILTLAAVLGFAGLTAVPANAAAQDCFDPAKPVTVEESRLGTSNVPGELVRRGGFTAAVDGFRARLCATTPAKAERLARAAGQGLWHAAVARAHRGGGDDRALYWARLELSKAVHQWNRPLTPQSRDRIGAALDRAARGMDDIRYPRGVQRLLVSGFDPFQLDGGNIRRSNPAGAAALHLDGTVFDTGHGKVAVQAVSFPVLWGAFDRGIVESAYGPALRGKGLSGVVTISQGRPGTFDIERFAGAWRGGAADNDRAGETGQVPPAKGWPQPRDQFIETTLPWQRMIDTAKGPYPVNFHRQFCQWPPGSTPGKGEPDCHESGDPDPGAVAASGGGGDYLSNESMYRANRLRLGLGRTALRGGHLHTPVLDQPAGQALTDPPFEANRKAIVDETVSMIPAVAG
ncbi:hypothetical protein [Sciscionella marina]|uniref:hypothetical protein n=1 Tax=Sciscionella marina TaxID=508770 RepID=UPI00036617CE|nr:hypothetical protein [Sciscionella marina]